MQVERDYYYSRLDNYLQDIQDYDVKGWQQQYTDLTTKYPFMQKHPKIQKKSLPFVKPKQRKDHKKCGAIQQTPTITSHLFCPAKGITTNVTSIKFMGPRHQEVSYSSSIKNNKNSSTKPIRPVSRLLIQLPSQYHQLTQSKNFVLQGQRSRYYSKKSKRKNSPYCKVKDPKDPLFQQMLSMTLPSFHDRIAKSLKRPNQQWFGGNKQSTFSKVSEQIKTKRCLSQKLTI